jgi:Diguanylate cyclase, GGDEF domain
LLDNARLVVGQLQVVHGAHTIGITISVGVSQLERHESAQSWIERTDQALYQAKLQGRDRVIAANDADCGARDEREGEGHHRRWASAVTRSRCKGDSARVT